MDQKTLAFRFGSLIALVTETAEKPKEDVPAWLTQSLTGIEIGHFERLRSADLTEDQADELIELLKAVREFQRKRQDDTTKEA